MASLTSILLSRGFLKVLYTGNMLWHTSAFVHFTFRQAHTMLRIGRRAHSKTPYIASTPAGDAWHHDILVYLGNINLGFVTLAAFRLYSIYKYTAAKFPVKNPGKGVGGTAEDLDILALTVLGIANASQAYGNIFVLRQTDRWIVGKGFDRITVLDTVFAVLDLAVVGAKLRRGW
ncbi:hypothetical protein BKA65DRAFT_500204 [Rhexocercosporidium sp. MPI-PUGE-AT-0058]|nr:hypothetical protein BKA65DRAFT_500204 [Rhexocercosporidium sp. MPI-PUGE-AT-0058]